MTTIYLMRHAHKNENINYSYDIKNIQELDEKRILSPMGENQAIELCNNNELKNINYIYTSNYVRTMLTVNYLSAKNNLKINVDKDLGERIKSKLKLNVPNNYRINQIMNENYRLQLGESRKQVQNRMEKIINKLINIHNGENILIVSHKNAITMYLLKWCEFIIIDEKVQLKYKDKIIHNGIWNGEPETFKLVFDNQNLVQIDKII